jgi:hypothetical protein
MLPLVLAIVDVRHCKDKSANVTACSSHCWLTVIIKIKVPMLPLVLAIVGDRHYKDKIDNVTTCSCHCW